MHRRSVRAHLARAAERWSRLGHQLQVQTGVSLVAGLLAAAGAVSGVWVAHESNAVAAPAEAALAAEHPMVPVPTVTRAPMPLAPPTASAVAAVAPDPAVPTTTYPWVVVVDPSVVTSSTIALPPGAFLTTAQAKDLIRSRFPRGEWSNALAVAECESGFQNFAVNVNTNRTRDLGLFQINDGGTLQELGGDEGKAFDPVWNVDAAYRLWRAYGWIRWTCAFRVGILDPALTSTTGSSTTTTAPPSTRSQSPTTFVWPLATTTTTPPGPAPTAAPTTAPTTAPPTTAAPTTSPPTSAPVTTSATAPPSGPPTS
jgi:hypothetical protein